MIITHVSPDWDAVTACWLLQRFAGMAADQVAFVNTGNPDLAVLEQAAAVVDTGREFDPTRLRFDHHQFSGKAASQTCAAEQVFVYLIVERGLGLEYLRPLVRLITAGDTGSAAANESRTIGLHRLLSSQKVRKTSDEALLVWGYDQLDLIAEGLQRDVEARASVDAHTVYRSDDGLLIALDNAPQGATFAAYDMGYRVVVWQNDQTEGTHGVGVNRSNEWSNIHAGSIVDRAMNASADPVLMAELATWFRHPSGFFAGRGTAKAPRPDPVLISLDQIAMAIDSSWTDR